MATHFVMVALPQISTHQIDCMPHFSEEESHQLGHRLFVSYYASVWIATATKPKVDTTLGIKYCWISFCFRNALARTLSQDVLRTTEQKAIALVLGACEQPTLTKN